MTTIFMNKEKDIRLFAVFVSQLIREGVTFSIMRDEHSIEVTLTGGY